MEKSFYTDQEIITHIRQGKDHAVINYVYKQHYPVVRNIVLSRGGNTEEAKDIFQETILVLFKRIIENRYGLDLNIQAFISGVSVKLWIDKIRKNKRLTFNDELLKNEYAQESYSRIYDEEKEKVIDEVLSAMGDKCKEILTYVIYHKFSMKEIADKMGFLNEDSAKTQHYKCRQKLVNRFKDNQALKQLLKGD